MTIPPRVPRPTHYPNTRLPRPHAGGHALTDLEYRLLLAARAAHAAGETPTAGELGRRAGMKYTITDQRQSLQRLGLWPWGNKLPPRDKAGLKIQRTLAKRAAAAAVATPTTIEAERAEIEDTQAAIRAEGIKDMKRPDKDDNVRPWAYRRAHAPETVGRGADSGEVCRGYVQEWKRLMRRVGRRAS